MLILLNDANVFLGYRKIILPLGIVRIGLNEPLGHRDRITVCTQCVLLIAETELDVAQAFVDDRHAVPQKAIVGIGYGQSLQDRETVTQRRKRILIVALLGLGLTQIFVNDRQTLLPAFVATIARNGIGHDL